MNKWTQTNPNWYSDMQLRCVRRTKEPGKKRERETQQQFGEYGASNLNVFHSKQIYPTFGYFFFAFSSRKASAVLVLETDLICTTTASEHPNYYWK